MTDTKRLLTHTITETEVEGWEGTQLRLDYKTGWLRVKLSKEEAQKLKASGDSVKYTITVVADGREDERDIEIEKLKREAVELRAKLSEGGLSLPAGHGGELSLPQGGELSVPPGSGFLSIFKR